MPRVSRPSFQSTKIASANAANRMSAPCQVRRPIAFRRKNQASTAPIAPSTTKTATPPTAANHAPTVARWDIPKRTVSRAM